MAIMMGDAITNGALVGSVLFVGPGPTLAQENADFYWDAATNTLKSKDQSTTATSGFGIGTGTVTSGNGSSSSGPLVIETGGGQPHQIGGGSAGNSGTVTMSTGPGGAASGGSNPGVSGNLLLKTGAGGGNAAASSTGGNAGNIILQPGNGGSGTSAAGAGGSTIVRASNSGDILAVQNSAGTTTHMGVANNGNVRMGAPASTARLQLGAGTSTLPPLKLTAGTLLSAPAAGALEYDGSALYFTAGTIQRPLQTGLEVSNVLDFGAKGDGTNDDSAAFQAAVDSLIETGGIIWVPPNRKYVVGNVNVKARYPVCIASGMYGHFLGGNAATTQNQKASITPKTGTGTTHIFKWERHAALTANGLGLAAA